MISSSKNEIVNPVIALDTRRKLKVQCTFSLCPVPRGIPAAMSFGIKWSRYLLSLYNSKHSGNYYTVSATIFKEHYSCYNFVKVLGLQHLSNDTYNFLKFQKFLVDFFQWATWTLTLFRIGNGPKSPLNQFFPCNISKNRN